MIVSDEWKFVIATPTKSGNWSMRATAEAFVKRGGDPRVLRQYTSGAKDWQHQLAVPPGMEDYDRWIMVRDPSARLVSIFEWLRRRPSEWGHWFAVGDFADFVRIYQRQRAAVEAEGFHAKRLQGGTAPYKWAESYATMRAVLAGEVDPAARAWGRRSCGLVPIESVGPALSVVAARATARWQEEHGADPGRPFAFPAIPHRNAVRQELRWRDLRTPEDYWRSADLEELRAALCRDDEALLGG